MLSVVVHLVASQRHLHAGELSPLHLNVQLLVPAVALEVVTTVQVSHLHHGPLGPEMGDGSILGMQLDGGPHLAVLKPTAVSRDRGIDGRITFTVGAKGEMGQALVSVKSGGVALSVIKRVKSNKVYITSRKAIVDKPLDMRDQEAHTGLALSGHRKRLVTPAI